MNKQPAKKKSVKKKVRVKKPKSTTESPAITDVLPAITDNVFPDIAAESSPNLRYSRPFDNHIWSDHPNAEHLVENIWDDYFREKFERSGKGKRPKLIVKDHLKVLLLNIFAAAREDSELYLGIPLAKGKYKASRYNTSNVSWVISSVIHHAHKSGLIELHPGSEWARMVSRIKATPLFIREYLHKYDIPVWAIVHHYHQEVIVLNKKDIDKEEDFDKSKKARPIEYNDTDYSEIPKMRAELEAYNELIKHTFIDIPTLEKPIIEHDKLVKGRPEKQTVGISQDNKFTRRIFYRGQWNLGGRFHGGWWQQIGEEWRKQIYINDKPTYEQDFSGLHVNLAYGLEGQNPVDDPYTVDPILDIDKIELRRIVKKFVLIAINDKSFKSSCSAFRDGEETGSVYKRLKNKELLCLLDAFIEKNKPIKKYLCTDTGVEFMAMDGRITARIIYHFTNNSIPILTIHDSYITNDDYVSELITTMNGAIKDEIGFEINIDKQYFKFTEALANPGNELYKHTELSDFYDNTRLYPRTNEYKQRLKLFLNNQRNIQC